MNNRTYSFVAIMISLIFGITTQIFSAETTGTIRTPLSVARQPVPATKERAVPKLQHSIKLPAGQTKPILQDRSDLGIVWVRIMANENLGFWNGSLMPIHATVINSSQITSPSFLVKFVVRGGPQSQNTPVYTTTVSMDPISPNMMNTAVYNFTLNNAIPGEGDIEVIVDPQNAVPEINEGNNSYHKNFFIHAP